MSMRAAGGGGSSRAALRSLTRDNSVKDAKIKKGTLGRIWQFAKPFKAYLLFFLFTVVIDSFLTVTSPLLLKALIDKGVIPKDNRLVIQLALLVGLLAILDAFTNWSGRWFSSRIGEGLIFEMRTQVFDHIQKQSIAFFTRTQTGALISRINSDVIGAQNALTDTLSGVISNVLTLCLVAGAMFVLSWQITLISLLLLPLFLFPTKWVGKKISELTRDSFNLNAEMSSIMTERFNVSGALLVSLYGEPSREHEIFRGRARRVADIGIRVAMLNRLFFSFHHLNCGVSNSNCLRSRWALSDCRISNSWFTFGYYNPARKVVRPPHFAFKCASRRNDCPCFVRTCIRST